MNNVTQTVISQYANSPTLLGIINSFNAAVDPCDDINNFYTMVWDVATAQGFGLDIWGRIVGVGRTIGTTPATVLTDSQFRQLILLKALANISPSTSYAINSLLLNWMTGNGRCYVNDLGNMESRYMFEFQLQQFEIDIVTQSGIFPHPAGVGVWMVTTPVPVFGFSGMTDIAVGFNQAPFISASNPYAVA